MSKEVQAAYMQLLVEKATEKLNKIDVNKLAFDPQGRVLVDVNLDAAVLKQLELLAGEQGLATALGLKNTPVTTVSLDIHDLPHLKAAFEKKLVKGVPAQGLTKSAAEKFMSLPKGSVIALQQELHFHLALVSRVYQQVVSALNDPTKMHAAHEAAMLRVNKLVMEALAEGLNASYKNNEVNIAQLNKSLDRARKKIAPLAHLILQQEISAKTSVELTHTNLKQSKKALKKVAEQTTATANNLLHTEQNGLVVLIEGSEQTAHKRIAGQDFAHRKIVTHVITPDGVKANKSKRLQIRTPSPVMKEGFKEDIEYVKDVQVKLKQIAEHYQFTEHLDKNKPEQSARVNVNKQQVPQAFIYNSYTAIRDILDDIATQNLQSESAVYILRGAHGYNASQLNTDNPIFCFVQNISVNGFGRHLEYSTDNNNSLVKETTLMAEVAMLHTLSGIVVDQHHNELISQVFKNYKKYLNINPQTKRPQFFSDSAQGKKAFADIQFLKTLWMKNPDPVNPTADRVTLSKQGLKNMMANNLHMSHQYAKLVQSLSVFVEKISLSGCKSGNERAQAINGRVAILDRVFNKDNLSEDEQAILHQLISLAQSNKETIASNAKALKSAIDKVYNQTGLQSAMSLISLVDQGAAAKVEAKPLRTYFSRNYAEESTAVLTNLAQKYSGSMQAHKSLAQMMLDATDIIRPPSWWSRMNSSKWGIIGAIIGFLLVVPAILAAYNTYQHNQFAHRQLAKVAEDAPAFPPAFTGLGSGVSAGSINDIDDDLSLTVEPASLPLPTPNADAPISKYAGIKSFVNSL